MNKAADIIFFPAEEFCPQNQKWMGCPSIERTGKRTWISWFTGGKYEPCIYNYACISYFDDSDEVLGEPYMVILCHPEDGQRINDPQLWRDAKGRLWVFWAQQSFSLTAHASDYDTPGDVLSAHFMEHQQLWGMYTENPEADEPVWSQPRYIADGNLRNKATVLSDGTTVLPCYLYEDRDHYRYLSSCDDGMSVTVERGPAKHERNSFEEPMIVERKDGSLWFLVRTFTGHIAAASSFDGGKTWTPTEETDIPNPCTRFYIGRLQNGMLLLVNTPSAVFGDRKSLVASLSEDDGKTWPYSLLLDDRRFTTYPDVTQAEDGRLYVVYDCQRDNRLAVCPDDETRSEAAKEICVASITVEDIINGKITSPESYLKRIANKSTYDKYVVGIDLTR